MACMYVPEEGSDFVPDAAITVSTIKVPTIKASTIKASTIKASTMPAFAHGAAEAAAAVAAADTRIVAREEPESERAASAAEREDTAQAWDVVGERSGVTRPHTRDEVGRAGCFQGGAQRPGFGGS